MKLLAALRREDGFTIGEVAIASAISVVALGLLSATMYTAMQTGLFAANQSTSLDGARQVLIQVARDLQGSKSFSMPCTVGEPSGSCAVIVVQPPTGPDQTIRIRLDDASLYRDTDDGTGTFPARKLLSNRIVNLDESPSVPLFSCSTQGSLLQVVQLKMLVQPDPLDAPHYNLETLVRPRMTYTPPGC